MLRRMALFLLLLLPFLVTGAVWMVWWLRLEQPLRSLFVEMDVNSPPVIIRGATHEWALIIPNGTSAVNDRVWRFDATSGTATAIDTPRRVAAVSPSLAFHSNDWWAWADSDSRLHVMSLPDAKELWQAPQSPRLLTSPAAYLSSPDGRYLIIPVSAFGPVEVWEIASGSKLASLDDLGDDQLRDFRFDTMGRLIIAGRSRDVNVTTEKPVNPQTARIVSYELPIGRVVKDVELPCSANDGVTLIDDKHCVVGNNLGSGQWWDMSTNPPRMTGPPQPWRALRSKDGRFSVSVNSLRLFDWSLLECATNRTIVDPNDPRISELCLPAPRMQPAFSPDGRFLKLTSHRVRIFPNWMPLWLTRLLVSSGLKDDIHELFLIDTATGQVTRRLPGDELLLAPENGDIVWTFSQDPSCTNGLAISEWPMKQPGPPWWLWTLTACVGAWYVWRRGRVGRRIAAKSRTNPEQIATGI